MRKRRYDNQPADGGPFDPYANNTTPKDVPVKQETEAEAPAQVPALLPHSAPAPIDPYANDDLQALLAMPELPPEVLQAPVVKPAKTVKPC